MTGEAVLNPCHHIPQFCYVAPEEKGHTEKSNALAHLIRHKRKSNGVLFAAITLNKVS